MDPSVPPQLNDVREVDGALRKQTAMVETAVGAVRALTLVTSLQAGMPAMCRHCACCMLSGKFRWRQQWQYFLHDEIIP